MSSLHRLPKNQAPPQLFKQESSESCNSNEPAFAKAFEACHINADGNVFIASSSLSGYKFNGFLTKFNSPDDVPKSPLLSLNPNQGGCANLLAVRNNLVGGFDSGNLVIVTESLEEVACLPGHDHVITKMDLNRLKTKLISSSRDASLILWDLELLSAVRRLPDAHSAPVWDVAFNPTDDNLVVSCSEDLNILLWDFRLPKPAKKLTAFASIPTCLCWSLNFNSKLYVGTDSGKLFLLDVADLRQENWKCLETSKHRLYRVKNIFDGTAIAVCSDQSSICVYETNSHNFILQNDCLHSDWVRDVCEFKGQLFSVGRDTKLARHDFSYDS